MDIEFDLIGRIYMSEVGEEVKEKYVYVTLFQFGTNIFLNVVLHSTAAFAFAFPLPHSLTRSVKHE